MGFEHHSDAQRLLRELRERLRQFALELQADKTRLIEFGRYAAERRQRHGLGKPESFEFLGFTHSCVRLRTGEFTVKRTTMRTRMRSKLQAVKAELKRRRHHSVDEQGQWLGMVVRGHNAYYSVPTNIHAIEAFRVQVERHWLRSLRRRSQRDRTNWKRLRVLSKRFLPASRIQHPWPVRRFDVKTQGRSPVR